MRGRLPRAADRLRALSDRLKAPLIHSVKGKDIMPYNDPRWMGGIGMSTKAVYNAIMGCDLLLMVGTDYPYSNFLPSKGTVIQIDEAAASAWTARSTGTRIYRLRSPDP